MSFKVVRAVFASHAELCWPLSFADSGHSLIVSQKFLSTSMVASDTAQKVIPLVVQRTR